MINKLFISLQEKEIKKKKKGGEGVGVRKKQQQTDLSMNAIRRRTCMDVSERFRRVTVKRNVTPVLDEGKVMQERKEQSGPHGEELFKASSVPQRKLQWQ